MYENLPKLTQDPAHWIHLHITLKFFEVFFGTDLKISKNEFFSQYQPPT